MKGLNKAVIIISKIVEVFNWVGCALCLFIIGVSVAGKTELLRFLTDARTDHPELSGNGFSIELAKLSDEEAVRAFIIFFVTMLITLALTAMIFRYIHLSFKTAAGETRFAEGVTPFQPAVIRMIRRIGWFTIAIPVAQTVMGFIGTLVIGGAGEIHCEYGYIVFGLIVLALSQFFVYGAELQKETDGLV